MSGVASCPRVVSKSQYQPSFWFLTVSALIWLRAESHLCIGATDGYPLGEVSGRLRETLIIEPRCSSFRLCPGGHNSRKISMQAMRAPLYRHDFFPNANPNKCCGIMEVLRKCESSRNCPDFFRDRSSQRDCGSPKMPDGAPSLDSTARVNVGYRGVAQDFFLFSVGHYPGRAQRAAQVA